eukprot:TRINITY_DN300_c0_g1_i1.p1 TRINITY_DN300_c0_g1~~TRINITY_DN300_c0_g1_i1.p1  ORF type:complete len:103 (+),score=47.15 TRINITY_DN300_c0_g1_i1:222-530(+)
MVSLKKKRSTSKQASPPPPRLLHERQKNNLLHPSLSSSITPLAVHADPKSSNQTTRQPPCLLFMIIISQCVHVNTYQVPTSMRSPPVPSSPAYSALIPLLRV